MNSYEYEKYLATKEDFHRKINRYGVAIIPNVLTSDEIKNAKKGMWDTLEFLSKDFEVPIEKSNKKTWRSIYDFYPLHSMLIQHWGFSHAQFVWDLRQNPKIVDIFSELWELDPNDLLVSFDGISIHMPPEITNRGYWRKDWLHTDQSYVRNNFECVQGMVTLYDVNPGDATLTFYESSNKLHKKFAEKFDIRDRSDWFKLTNEEHIKFYEKRCEQKRIRCPAGSMIFWDSRTIHSGSESIKGREKPNMRCVVYICMMPRSDANDRMLEKKRQAFNDKRTTNHYANNVKLFAKHPRTYGSPLPSVPELDDPVLTRLGKKLAGF